MNSRGLALAVLLPVVAGCAMPKTPVYEKGKGIGRQFCADVANRAQLVSTNEMGVGIFLLTVGGAAATASGVLATISANSTEHRQLLGYVGAGLSVAPLLAVPFGMVMISRSDEASALAATANTAVALSETDEDAFRDCTLAKAAWVGSRTDATALARKALEEDKDEQRQRDEEAAEEEQRRIEEEASETDEATDEATEGDDTR